jgi:FkbM family methyltransferase
MLIPLHELYLRFHLKIKGILHIGAHECEEKTSYNKLQIMDENIYWVEALPNLVNKMKKTYPKINIYQGVIYEENDKEVKFNVSNNVQSSSILEFGSHLKHHPQVHYTRQIIMNTTRMDTLIERERIPMENINFLNLDIQGVELSALKSMEKYLSHVDYIYTEVNTEEVYKGCCLLQELDEYLKQFRLIRVALKICENYGWGDALYIRIN